jgi:hypothetical protein
MPCKSTRLPKGCLCRGNLLPLLVASVLTGVLTHPAAAQPPIFSSDNLTYSRRSPESTSPGTPVSSTAMYQPAASRAAAQAGRPKGYDDEVGDLQVHIEPPDPARLFERDSEASWKIRIVEESRRKMGGPRVIFPDYQTITRDPFMRREFPPLTELVEPGFVMHGRLLFEQPNLERYGWDLGILTPAISVAGFYKDVLLLPYHCWTRPLQRCDSSAGKCLPGDPTPLLLYPPELSLTGLAGEAGVIVLGFFVFP